MKIYSTKKYFWCPKTYNHHVQYCEQQ